MNSFNTCHLASFWDIFIEERKEIPNHWRKEGVYSIFEMGDVFYRGRTTKVQLQAKAATDEILQRFAASTLKNFYKSTPKMPFTWMAKALEIKGLADARAALIDHPLHTQVSFLQREGLISFPLDYVAGNFELAFTHNRQFLNNPLFVTAKSPGLLLTEVNNQDGSRNVTVHIFD